MHGVASWHSRLGTSVLCLHQAETGVVRHSSLDLSPRAREHDEPPVDYGHKRKLCLYSAPEHAVVAWPISAPGSTAYPPSSSLAHPINPIRTWKSRCGMSLGTYSAAPVVTRKEHLRHSRLMCYNIKCPRREPRRQHLCPFLAWQTMPRGPILHEPGGASDVWLKGSIDLSTSAFVEMNAHCGKSSILSQTSLESNGTIGWPHPTLQHLHCSLVDTIGSYTFASTR